MIGVFAESTYLVAYRGESRDHLVMKPSGVGSRRWRIVYSTETDWEVIDFLVDTRGCVLLFEESRRDRATRLRLLSVDKISTKTRDLAHNIGHPEYLVCVQVTEF